MADQINFPANFAEALELLNEAKKTRLLRTLALNLNEWDTERKSATGVGFGRFVENELRLKTGSSKSKIEDLIAACESDLGLQIGDRDKAAMLGSEPTPIPPTPDTVGDRNSPLPPSTQICSFVELDCPLHRPNSTRLVHRLLNRLLHR